MIKAIFLDFDNTLYSHKINKIPDSAVFAIKKVQEKGIKVFICTGRPKVEFIQFDLRDINFDGYLFNNGQLCYDNNYQNVIYSNPFDKETKEFVIDLFNSKKMPVMVCDNDSEYVNFIDDHFKEVQTEVGSKLPEVKEYSGEEFSMVAIYYKTKEDEDLLMSYSDKVKISKWHEGAIDMIPFGTSKLTGINNIAKYYNINIDEVMCVGDGDNDLEMIKYAGVGVAMGNSDEKILKIADYITSDIDDNGLFNAFKHYDLF